MTAVTKGVKARHGGWLPVDETALATFRTRLAEQVAAQPPQALVPPVQAFSDLVENTPLLRMHLTQAINEAIAAGYTLGYKDIPSLMVLINGIMTYAPPFDTTALVGCPINALLDWPMCMPSGFAFFQFTEVNAAIQAVLNYWTAFLAGPNSRNYLNTTNPTGWFSPDATPYVNMNEFICDPTQPYYGFASWNAFFDRLFAPGFRPVVGAGVASWVNSAAEATPYNIQYNVQLTDTFWIKTQPYSLQDIFTAAQAPLAQSFVGGAVYQAFLSAYNYHRWNAPVNGTVTAAYNVPGTYYSDAFSEGLDPAGPNDSQGYITAVATRAIIVIDTGVAGLGQVACVFVGMAEISSCVIEVSVGQLLAKGDELGYFQYGGSTHCLIFQPGVKITFLPQPPFNEQTPIVQVNSQLATVVLPVPPPSSS